MNPEVKSKWVAALRSGDYKQGTIHLNHNNESFCCLGVLCEIAVAEGVVNRSSPSYFGNSYSYDGNSTAPPPSVLEWAGLPPNQGNPKVNGSSLMYLNDEELKSFDYIAGVIEEEL